MTYKVLSLKWRPKKFEEIIGQDHITKALSNAIKLNRIAHAFIFSGPRGVGKTSTARILSSSLNSIDDISKSLDIYEMDAASNRGIDEIRNLKENINYPPSQSKYKIYIIDEAHMLTKEAFNALLKTLEEPPSYIVFILATTELHKMPETIISRTQRYDFKRISSVDIGKQILTILNYEKIKSDESSVKLIASKADGSMRDALSILDQMICFCNGDLQVDKIKEALGIIDDDEYFKLFNFIGQKETSSMLSLLNEILNSGISIINFIDGFNNFIRNQLFLCVNGKSKLKNNIYCNELDLLRILEIGLKFRINMKNYHQPRILLDSMLLKLSHLDRTVHIDKFLSSSMIIDDIDKNLDSNDIKTDEPKPSNSVEKDDESISDSSKIEVDDEVINNKENLEKDDESISDSSKIEVDNEVISSKENSSDSVKENLEKDKNKYNELESQWSVIVSKLNPKIGVLLENSNILKISNNMIYIEVIEANNFIVNALEKDKIAIQNFIKNDFDLDININFSFKFKKEDKKNDIKEEVKDDEHPLIMDALNKFNGEIIK